METALQQSAATAGGGGGGMSPGAATVTARHEEQEELQQAAAAEGGLDEELRRGPWTVDEDLTLINYIADHGEGRWNALARAAGLKRTGKSCRLRWLNYLRPDVKRGDFTADEQLLILDLHSRWGNRWSKIAAHLPGRTDNEIKNYWRTRVQKHAKQLNCDVNSKRFKDAMRFLWMPRLAERAASAAHQPQPQPQHVAGACNSNVLQVVAASSSCCRSPSSAAVTTAAACSSSSACSSLTSESAHDDGARHAAAGSIDVLTAAADDDYWGAVTTMQQQPNDDHYDFWSTASALQQHLAAADHHHHHCFQFQQPQAAADQDLTGWVQGFSDDGILSGSSSDSLWSLDDIWRMQ